MYSYFMIGVSRRKYSETFYSGAHIMSFKSYSEKHI